MSCYFVKIKCRIKKDTHEDFGFTIDVSKDEKFVKYEKLPSGLKETFQAELTLFDKNNTVIQ